VNRFARFALDGRDGLQSPHHRIHATTLSSQ
jgi:hypothetical protein